MTTPLVPVDCDLRDFPYMPVDIARLFGSEFHARATDAEWRAGVTLWLKSFHQVPAASLPNDDVALARLAELGRDTKTWAKLKGRALHGWITCDDGRLYHPVVAEKALEAWIEKLVQRKASAAGNAKRWGTSLDGTEDIAIADAVAMLAAINPQSRTLAKKVAKVSRRDPGAIPPGYINGHNGVPPGHARGGRNGPGGNPETVPVRSQGKGREVEEPSDGVGLGDGESEHWAAQARGRA